MSPAATRALLVAVGLVTGALIGALAYVYFTPSTPDGYALNGLTTEQAQQWTANPSFFVRRGADFASNHPSMPPQSFPAEKEAEELRLFVVGGSQVMGDPYVHSISELSGIDLGALQLTNSGGIATWLEKYLQILHPQRRVRVVNAAVGSQDLGTAARVLEEVLRVGQPDFVVVLSGNNESYNRRFESRQDFDAAVAELSDRFAANLERVVRATKAAGIRTYLATVATNIRDWLPADANQGVASAEIRRFLDERRWAAALELLAARGGRDHALFHYFHAKQLESEGGFDAAYRAYVAAKDNDYNLIRAHSAWNDAVRSVRSAAVTVVDLEATMRARAHGGIPGFDLFHDHCHFKIDVNVAAAKAIAQAHQRAQGLAATELPDIDARAFLRENLRALYAIKESKWKRLRRTADFDYLGDRNRENVEREFEQAKRDMEKVEGVIELYESDLDAEPR